MKLTGVRSFILIALGILALGIGAVVFYQGPGNEMYMSHAHCYLFNRKLIMLHGWSDMLIGLSYVSISCTLLYLVFRSRRELPFHWMMLAFATFIIACGMTHFMEVWTLQAEHPRYWLSGWVKVVTAIASLTTAVLLPPLVPKIRALLLSARMAIERKAALEKAYIELNDIYTKALAAMPDSEMAQADRVSKEAYGNGSEFPLDLAVMAKRVTLHAQELERARQQAEAANRAKDEFLAVLSHELRTPLTPALASASYLESATDIDPAELRQALSLIRRNIELEARLVDDLLDITRISKGKLEVHHSTIDLHETVHHAADMCRSSALNKQIDLTVDAGAAEHYVRGDGARLAQVFWNLILNAVKFTPANGRITLRTSNPKAAIVRVEISDSGIGIAPEMLSRIFEPFEQGEKALSRNLGGVGLGLSIAKALVEAHDGSITARSDGKDKGATFIIELATIAPKVAVRKSGDPSPATATQRSLRILVVEDHEDTRSVLSRMLGRWGHVVESAATVTEAMEIAVRFETELLISDIGLPDGTGMELLGKLHRERNFPAIAMSGYGMESDLEQTRLAGFLAHLIKPIAAERLKETIAHLFPG
ncbi:MAG: ATP-binding protein [Chthoniobacteraceae bacterium]